MYYPLTLCIGLRYIKARKKNHFISFISWVSLLGITLGVMALITVLSVLNGFDREIKTRILAMTPHITLSGLNGTLSHWPDVQKRLLKQGQVMGSAPFIEGQGMISSGGRVHFAMIEGIEPEQEKDISSIAQKMISGQLENLSQKRFGIVLGKGLAASLGVQKGDFITLVIPEVSLSVAGVSPRLKRFEVVGVFQFDFRYDQSVAFIHLNDAAALYHFNEAVTGLRIRLQDLYEAPHVSDEIALHLGGDYYLSDWTRQNEAFFATLKMEKRVMFLMLSLIVAVAAFNILATLVMIVTEKRSHIAILKTIGACPRHILQIFMVQGSMIGLLGTLLGSLLGVLLALNVTRLVQGIEHLFGVQFLSQQFYYISFLPSQLVLSDVLTIGVFSFLISVVATVYPAWQASRIQPAEALRYE